MSKKFKVTRFLAGESTRVKGKGGYKNIQFEGLLCSAIADSGRVYFTIDAEGNGLNSYKENILGSTSYVNFSLRHKRSDKIKLGWTWSGTDTDKNPMSVQEGPLYQNKIKPDVVEVIRYFRRTDEFGSVSSQGGLTVICQMNYDTMIMKVYPAFCSNDENFNKLVGLTVARNRQYADLGVQFKFDRDLSIKDNLYNAISRDGYDYTSDEVELNDVIFKEFQKCIDITVDYLPIL